MVFHQAEINIIIGLLVFFGTGIFTTNFYFIKMAINNNIRMTKIETYCRAVQDNKHDDLRWVDNQIDRRQKHGKNRKTKWRFKKNEKIKKI